MFLTKWSQPVTFVNLQNNELGGQQQAVNWEFRNWGVTMGGTNGLNPSIILIIYSQLIYIFLYFPIVLVICNFDAK